MRNYHNSAARKVNIRGHPLRKHAYPAFAMVKHITDYLHLHRPYEVGPRVF
jgi:hypothetical protein